MLPINKLKRLFLADIAHVGTFELGRDNSSAVALIPSRPAKPGIFWRTFESLASVSSEYLAAFAFARLQIQSPAVHAFFPWKE